MTNNPLRIDPFFDGEGSRSPGGGGGAGGRPWLPGFIPPPPAEGYQDASIDPETKRRMRGGGGVIIPHATMDGIPQGTDPHNTRMMEVNVDPHLQGQSVTVRLGDITKESLQNAKGMVHDAGVPAPRDRETARLYGAAMLHGVAAQAASRAPMSIPAAPAPPYSGPAMPNIPAPNLARTVGEPQAVKGNGRTSRPLQFFQPPAAAPPQPQPVQQSHTEPPVRMVNLSQHQPTDQPPRCRVHFEIEHFGQHSVLYHDVVVELDRNFMVLVYNRNYRGGDMYLPPVSDNPPKMAINIEGSARVYLVQTTGLHYSYGDHDFRILMIEATFVPPEHGHDGQDG